MYNIPGMRRTKHRKDRVTPQTDAASGLLDTRQRALRDLRISITDRCNLRCTYCMPRELFGRDFAFLPRAELLSFEEIERVARLAIALGVRKIRLSGGEPLLRHGVETLVEKLARLDCADGTPLEVAMTTNGVLLAKKARALKDAGLARVTVSLDGLSQATFARMSDSRVSVATVLDGIAAAHAAGLAPLKVNTVVKRGVNAHEIVPLVAHFRGSGIIVRFIEYMDVGSTNGWRLDDVVSAQEIVDALAQHYTLRAIDANYPGEVARRWQVSENGGEVGKNGGEIAEIGVIASVTQAFCGDCSRLRLSTDGKLYTCLFASAGTDLRGSLRSRGSEGGDAEIAALIAATWQGRGDRYSQLRREATPLPLKRIEMSYIGG